MKKSQEQKCILILKLTVLCLFLYLLPRWIAIAGFYVFWLTVLWCSVLWLRPLWILHASSFLKQHSTITLPDSLISIEIPLRFLLLVSFFQHLPRVTDAWMNAKTTLAQKSFNKKVKEYPPSQATVANFTGPDPVKVQQYAKLIAWECLKQTYQPSSVQRQQVLAVLAVLNGYDTAEAFLWYLEKRLGTIQTTGKRQDKIRFNHDLLAEYLASIYLVEICQDNEANWRQFLARVDVMPDKQAMRGFLLAVWDCSVASHSAGKIPSFVPEELGKRLGIFKRSSLQLPLV